MKTDQAKKQENSDLSMTYTVKEVSQILKVSIRKAYNLCNATADFRVMKIGKSIRVVKASFDDWFDSCGIN